MTYLLALDPGKNSGAALGYYSATEPYRLIDRYQVHNGVEGFIEWWGNWDLRDIDEIVCELFVLDPQNQFTADLTPVKIEGALLALCEGIPITWQPRTDKAALTGYPKSATTKSQRQRVRFDFLARFGWFRKGTENDDSNDAITHALVYLKRRKHMPTIKMLTPDPRGSAAA